MLYFQELFKRLSLTKENGLFLYSEKTWEELFPVKTTQTLHLLEPYAFFVFNNEPIILFFDEKVNTSETHTACWNFNVTPIIFFVSQTDIKIYNAFEITDVETKEPLLKKLAENNDVEQFSFWNLASGETFTNLQKQLDEKNRVDKKLLANIKDARSVLNTKGLSEHITNSLIGRLIFIRYLIDRQVVIRFYLNNYETLSKESFLEIINSKETLYSLFGYIQDKFKGDLFPIDEGELNSVKSEHLSILYRLFKGDEIGSGQFSLFKSYRFDIIPIEFISNIYEYFMGEAKQKDQKAYYTPTFLVNYMLNHTVSKYFEEKPDEFTCRILDPTCGSGIFLVEGFRRIVGQYEKKFGSVINNDVLKQIASENIFGIDKDKEAVSVAMFSLYITLLDYQNPKDIENFEFPSLRNKNFFVQDIFKYSTKDLQFKFLEPQEEDNYIAKLLNINFQFILGNPPWGQVPDSPYMQRMSEREKLEKIKIGVSDKQFAQAFLARTRDFCSKDTKCAIVVASKILYNNNADVFRKYFIDKFFIDEVLELSPVRKDVFVNNDGKKAIAPCAVLFYRYAYNQVTDDNQVTHISIKHNIFYNLLKILVIEKNDVKTLKQVNFKNYDWIWKVLLYGNALDFQFIKRLKDKSNNPKTIHDYISVSEIIKDGVGITIKGGDKNDVSYLKGKPFLNTQKKHLAPFQINVPSNSVWQEAIVHRDKKDSFLFIPPMLLIKKGTTRNFKISACVSKRDFIFTDSIISIKLFGENTSILHNLEGLFHSSLFTYFQLKTASSIGVERERILREELYSFPYLFDENVSNLARRIENELKTSKEKIDFYKIIESEQNSIFTAPEKAQQLRHLYKELNEAVYDLYDVSDIEKSLIDYAENFSIPLFHNEKRAFKSFNESNKNQLEIYASVFYEHFGKVFNGRNGKFFQIEVRLNKYFICMICKVIPAKPENKIEIIWDNDLGKADFLTKITLFSEGKGLYKQKDIIHFEANEFFIIKPNEMKCWHKALAYKDLFEIREEIIKSNQRKAVTA